MSATVALHDGRAGNARQAVALQQTLADLNRRLDRAIDGGA